MRLHWLATILLLPGLLLADELHEAYLAAQDMEFVTPSEVVLYDAVANLQEHPEEYAPVAIAHAQLQSTLVDGLDGVFDVMEMLYAAQRGDMEGYQQKFKEFRSRTRNAKLLKAADISELQDPCEECTRGFIICKVCKGSLKCPECRGRGTITTVAKSLSQETQKKVCSVCKGTKVCPNCKGERKVCEACHGTGKTLDVAKVRDRLKSMAAYTERKMAPMVESALRSREQSKLLGDELLQARSKVPSEALTFLETLPAERQLASQWSQVEVLKGVLRSRIEASSSARAEEELARRNLRQLIDRAQSAKDPLQGIELLIPAFDKYAECDALPEAQTALKGMVSTFQAQQRAEFSALQTRVRDLGMLQSPEERIRRADRILSEWPNNKKLDKFKNLAVYGEPLELADPSLAKDLDRLEQDVKRIRQNAVEEQFKAESEAEEAKPNYWLYGGLGVGALVVIYVIFAAISAIMERRKEAERKAKEKAVRDSIRNTFSHRRDR